MPSFDAQIQTLLLMDLLGKTLTSGQLSMLQYNALTALLVNQGISFDVSYTPGTRREAAKMELTTYLNPATRLVFEFDMGSASSGNTNQA